MDRRAAQIQRQIRFFLVVDGFSKPIRISMDKLNLMKSMIALVLNYLMGFVRTFI